MPCLHCLAIYRLLWTEAWRGRLVQLDFSAAFDRVSHGGVLYQFLFIVSEFLGDRQHRMRLDGKVCASVDVVSGLPRGSSVSEPLSFTFYTSEFFHIVENHIVGFADDTTIYVNIPGQFSQPQVMESLNQDLAALNSWCLKWHMRSTLRKQNHGG